MLVQFFDSPARIQALRTGCAGALLEAFAQLLARDSYAEITARRHLRAAEHFIDWGDRAGIPVCGPIDKALERFDRHLRRGRCPHFGHADRLNVLHGVRLFLKHLQDVGLIERQMVESTVPAPTLFVAFCQWMHQQRGSCESTLANYGIHIRELLKRLGDEPGTWDARGLRQFVLEGSQTSGWASAKKRTTALRMFLRFLIAEGKCAGGLDGAIPVLAHWRLASLPRYLPADQVERVIGSCNLMSPVGKRDRAILLLLARLGLRAGDIVQLRLCDIDWKGAWIHVCGKGRRQARLPLTQEVGQALVTYLQDGRPRVATDAVFVCCRAPFQAFRSHCAVSVIVDRALRRAGVTRPSRGAAHLLRHSVATSMLRHGASLQDVAALLRHRSIATTQIYAKVDVTALLKIAQPWPEGAAMLAEAVTSYVAIRRATGFTFRSEALLLQSFAAFSEARAESYVRVLVAIEWAGLARSVPQRARRLGIVMRFARYLRAEDVRHEIPPAVFGAEKRPRPVPYILSQEQIRQLVEAASRLGYPTLRRETYRTLFALLASTGLRVSEAIHLRLDDVTPDGLVIRCSKFRKSRMVPLHDTVRAGLDRYLKRRCAYAPTETHVFVSLRRKPLLPHDVDVAFRTAARAIGLPDRAAPRPTPHSLRHTFAVRALQACPDGRDAITQHMLALSTYLGHAKVADTYWYLDAVPELMTDIADRCEHFVMGGRP